jgi:hypothetical protein
MIDDEIRDALKIEPSPAFLARVRTQIANEPAPGALRWSWMFGAAATVAAGVVLALVISRPSVPTPATRSAKALAERPPGAATASAERLSPGATAFAERQMPRSTRSAKAVALRNTPEPEVLIDPRERRALLQLIAGVRDGRIDLAAAQHTATPALMELAPVTDIVIAPLTIDPLAPLSGAEGVRP